MTDAIIEPEDGASSRSQEPSLSHPGPAFLGRVLTLVGLALFAFSISFACAYPALLAVSPWMTGTPFVVGFWLAMGFGVAGLTLYAFSQHRNPAWGLMGGVPLVGPVLGLITLTPKSQTETGTGRAHLINELLRLSSYLIGLMITVWEISPRWGTVVIWLTTPSEAWAPSLESCCLGVSLEIPLFVLWVLSFTLAGRIVTSFYKQGVPLGTPWLLARTAVLGFSLLAMLATTLASLAAQNVFDRRATDALATLRAGLPRQVVEAMIEEANRTILIAKQPDGRSVANEANEQLLNVIRDARHETRNGQRILAVPNTLSWQFRNALFTCLGKEGDRTTLCYRYYTRGSDPDYGFSLRLTFTEHNTLAAARLETSKHQPRGRCRLVFEIPPSEQNKQISSCQS